MIIEKGVGHSVRHRHDQDLSVLRHRKSVSCRSRGSITVEAALCLPLFFFAAMLLMLLLEMAAIKVRVRAAAQYAAQQSAALQITSPALLSKNRLQADLTEAFKPGRLTETLLVGGSGGIKVDQSEMNPLTGIGYVRWSYRVHIPFPAFGSHVGTYEGELKYKAWNGYHGGTAITEKEEMVYVAENGIVYHKNPACTHLALSITPVSVHNLSTYRNAHGGKYHVCEKCGGAIPPSGVVFITKEGDRWHTDRHCSGLKRTVEKIPISQVGGRGPCSKCSQ